MACGLHQEKHIELFVYSENPHSLFQIFTGASDISLIYPLNICCNMLANLVFLQTAFERYSDLTQKNTLLMSH